MFLSLIDYLPTSIEELGKFALNIVSVVLLVWAFCFILKTIADMIKKFRS